MSMIFVLLQLSQFHRVSHLATFFSHRLAADFSFLTVLQSLSGFSIKLTIP